MGIERTASDEVVRQRYIELVRKHQPERDPHMFQKVRTAYDAIANERDRLCFLIFEPSQGESFKEWIEEIQCETRNRRLGLSRIRAIFHGA